jgi:hypothetical protein
MQRALRNGGSPGSIFAILNPSPDTDLVGVAASFWADDGHGESDTLHGHLEIGMIDGGERCTDASASWTVRFADQYMIIRPSDELIETVRQYAIALGADTGLTDFEQTVDGHSVRLPAFDFGGRLLVLADQEVGVQLSDTAKLFAQNRPEVFNRPGLLEVIIGIGEGGSCGFSPQVISLGIQAMPWHDALAHVIGMPEGWRSGQSIFVAQALSSVRNETGGGYRIARLKVLVDVDQTPQDAHDWMSTALSWGSVYQGWLLYFQAEAGKGKSTMLADLARRRLDSGSGPLPLLVPLRDLRRGGSISWEAMVAPLGAIGSAAANLAHAVRAGLVVLMLDGLDEVAGRYDPNVVKEVLDIVFERLRGDRSLLAVSGRTTEGTLLNSKQAVVQVGLELPGAEEPAFSEYADIVIKATVPNWPRIAHQLPEPPSVGAQLTDNPATDQEMTQLLEWVQRSFDKFGKDRSLFFVQSLARLGRTRQLQGKYLLNPEQSEPVAPCSLYDACILAASYACVRECDKVEEIARQYFSPAAQLDLLTWFALHASSEESLRTRLRRPNALVKDLCKIDSTFQNEQFNTVIRQMQKHALLFGRGEDLAAGDWRPAFLSDWLRCTFLVRSWLNRESLAQGEEREALRAIVARAERSRIAFQMIFPDVALRDRASVLDELASHLVRHADDSSPEACANYWALFVGLGDLAERLEVHPTRITELTDLSEIPFEGAVLGPGFSGNLAMFVATEFANSQLENCRFTQCDFTDAQFRNCRLKNVEFKSGCSGPIYFEDCEFIECTFSDGIAVQAPVWSFVGCHFDADCQISQSKLAILGGGDANAASFEGCMTEGPIESLLAGEWIGIDAAHVDGIERVRPDSSGDPVEECLVRLLRPFFPSRVGPPGQHQARPYIRSSAIGRGAFPPGSPSAPALILALKAEGFTTGGRQGHLYAPWSSVAGALNVELRNEMSTFLRNRERGPAIERLLDRIRQDGTWTLAR